MSIDLRAAEFENHWRSIKRRKYPSRLNEISYRNLSCLEDATVSFTGGITAIIGGNGVGKSTVAAAVADLLVGTQSDAQNSRVAGSTLHGHGAIRDKPAEFYSFDDDNCSDPIPESSFGWLDPAFAASIVDQLHADTNVGEMLEGVDPRVLDDGALTEISYLVNKRYDRCEIYEIEDYKDLPLFPYFKVRSGGNLSYSSESMGSGEVSLLTHYWVIKKLQKGSILVLEEPETFVSPHSQLALMNLIAKESDEKAIWALITTHSPTILRRIPVEDIRLLTHVDGVSSFTKRTTWKQIEELLGEGSSFRACLLVEDEGARAFLSSILDRLSSDMLTGVEILLSGDEAKISSAVEFFPITKSWFKLVGIFDGDMRTAKAGKSSKWPMLFLPGEDDPDLLLKKLLRRPEAKQKLAEYSRRLLDEISVACHKTEGTDHHDWPLEFARVLNLDIHSIRKHLSNVWLDFEDNQVDANRLVEELRVILA